MLTPTGAQPFVYIFEKGIVTTTITTYDDEGQPIVDTSVVESQLDFQRVVDAPIASGGQTGVRLPHRAERCRIGHGQTRDERIGPVCGTVAHHEHLDVCGSG